MTAIHLPHGVVENWWTGEAAATIVAAVVAAGALMVGYFVQQGRARRERRAQAYGEAVRAIEDYLEAPFIILRRDGTLVAQRQITDHISAVQSRIAFHRAELAIYAAQPISEAYAKLETAARAEAGAAMTRAWRAKPVRQGKKVPIGNRYSREQSNAALTQLVKLMRADVYR
jgi:hypothetical protein